MLFEVKDVDRRFYSEQLADFLPQRIIDSHTHLWLPEFQIDVPITSRGPTWPGRVADHNSAAELAETYRLMFPGREVTPIVFGMPERNIDFEANNRYVSQAAAAEQWPSLIITRPEWPAEDLERRVKEGGFLGLKPYLNMAPPEIPSAEIKIYDFLPPHHLEVADAHGWIVLLHVPRPARLKDPLNLAQMLEIEKQYPHLHLIIAHIGRAYCPEDVGNAMEVLGETRRMVFDFCANTSAYVMEQALRAFGPQRLLFGSDLPILRMRMRRICENGFYVNLVPKGLYGDVSDDPHMREVGVAEGEQLSFFMYEELSAFRCAAQATGLSKADVEDVFYNNAAQLIEAARTGR